MENLQFETFLCLTFLLFELSHPFHPGLVSPPEQRGCIDVGVGVVLIVRYLQRGTSEDGAGAVAGAVGVRRGASGAGDREARGGMSKLAVARPVGAGDGCHSHNQIFLSQLTSMSFHLL